MSTHAIPGRLTRPHDTGGDTDPVADRPTPTFPISTRSHQMLLMHEELARAQIAQRHADMAQSIRLARLAAARRRQRRAASAQRRLRLTLAAAR